MISYQVEKNVSSSVYLQTASIKKFSFSTKAKNNGSPVRIGSNDELQRVATSKDLKSQFFANSFQQNQNHKITQLNSVLNGTLVETRKSKPNALANLKSMVLDSFFSKNNSEDLDERVMLKNMNNTSKQLASTPPINSNSKEDTKSPKKSNSMEILSKLNKIGEEAHSNILNGDEIVSEALINIDQFEEIADLFMEEPVGCTIIEDSKMMVKSKKFLISSGSISQEAQDGIREFNDQNIKNNLLQVNEIFLYSQNCDNDITNEYKEDFQKKYQKKSGINLIFYVLFKSLLIFLSFIIKDEYVNIYLFFYVKLCLICAIIFIYFCYMRFKKTIFAWSIIAIYLFFLIEIVINEKYNGSKILVAPKLELMITYLSMTQFMFLSFVEVIILSCIYLAIEGIFIWNSIEEGNYFLILYIVGFALLNIGTINYRMKLQINLFNEIRNNNFEKGQLNKLIMYLLPPHVILLFIYFI